MVQRYPMHVLLLLLRDSCCVAGIDTTGRRINSTCFYKIFIGSSVVGKALEPIFSTIARRKNQAGVYWMHGDRLC